MCSESGRGQGPYCFCLNIMQNYSLKRLPFPPLNWLNTLSKNQLTILVVLALFLDSILFHWSNFMSKTLITVTLLSVLKFSKNKQCKFFNYVLFWRIFWLFHTLYLSIHISESTSFLLRKKKGQDFDWDCIVCKNQAVKNRNLDNIKSSDAWTKHISQLFWSSWIPLNNVLYFSV